MIANKSTLHYLPKSIIILHMKNIIDYTKENLNTFDMLPFNSVDSLILSSAAYIHFPDVIAEVENWRGIRFQELYCAEYFEEMFHNVPLCESTRQLFFAMAASPRFRDIRVMGYTEQFDLQTEKQFSAVTFRLQPNIYYIAYRGTDSTLVGWKEDFNMAFKSPVPSQEEAVRYIEKAAFYCPGKILTGGHSKGGNLAVYAASMCHENVQSRITKVYSHDGPGFLESTLQSPEFRTISDRIEKTIPQSSIVGMLLEQQEDFVIVKSRKIGLLQHDQYTWEIEGGNFVYIEKLTKDAKYADKTLTDWLKHISEEDRERFVDALYSVLNANSLMTLEDFRSDWQTAIPASYHALTQLDGETKKFILHTLKTLAAMGIKNVTMFGKEKPEKGAAT